MPRSASHPVPADLSRSGPSVHPTVEVMREPDTQVTVAEHLRIARLLEVHGDAIGAVLAYREVIRAGVEPAATEARRSVAVLARRATPARAP